MNERHTPFSAAIVGFVLGGAAMAGLMLFLEGPAPAPTAPATYPASAAFLRVDPDEIAARLLPSDVDRTSPEAWTRADEKTGLHVKYAAYVARGPSVRDRLVAPLTASLQEKLDGPALEQLAAIERSLPSEIALTGAIVGARDAARRIIPDGVYCRCALPYSIGASSGVVQSVLIATGESAYLVVTVREYPSRSDPDGRTDSSAADRPLDGPAGGSRSGS